MRTQETMEFYWWYIYSHLRKTLTSGKNEWIYSVLKKIKDNIEYQFHILFVLVEEQKYELAAIQAAIIKPKNMPFSLPSTTESKCDQHVEVAAEEPKKKN